MVELEEDEEDDSGRTSELGDRHGGKACESSTFDLFTQPSMTA